MTALHIGSLRPAHGSRKRPKRVGRGVGSGHGRTATRGHKGHKSRSGFSQPPGFEGGQMPLHRRVPKRGFRNPLRMEYQEVNVGRLQELVDQGRLSPGTVVTPELLYELRIIRSRRPVKILGDGELQTALEVHAHHFSATAQQKIMSAGGKVVLHGTVR
ncbi:MAG: 50S ribosomal protein L15 [Candidatus Kapabacteria bacterium]|nr:50S ribosomal protein L15 [Candidatus Kapabacteria bacterium]MDW8011437.1 50S ribosomal protein L15 [Bacteroidota bacterium]